MQASPPLPGARLQGQVTLQMVFQMTHKVPCKHWPGEDQLLKVLDSTLGWTCVLGLRLCFYAYCGHHYLPSVSMGCDPDGWLWFTHRKNDVPSHYGLDQTCPLKVPVLKTWSPNLWCCGRQQSQCKTRAWWEEVR